MNIPQTIAVPLDKLLDVIEMTKWYDAMPQNDNFGGGDRFHEKFNEYQMSIVPDEISDGEIGDDISHIELVNGTLRCAVMDDSKEDGYTYITFIAK